MSKREAEMRNQEAEGLRVPPSGLEALAKNLRATEEYARYAEAEFNRVGKLYHDAKEAQQLAFGRRHEAQNLLVKAALKEREG